MLGVYTIVRTTDFGWGSVHTIGFGATAIALLAAFVVRERLTSNPLLPLRIFRSRNLSGANAVLMLMVAGMFGMFFLGTLYLQRVLGYDPIQVGLAFLPVSLGIGALSLGVSAPLVTRFGARRVLIPALALLTLGLVLFSRAPLEANYATDLLPAMVLLGVGAGLGFTALTSLAMSGATPCDSGLASGLYNTMQQVGGALGLSVLAALAASDADRLLASGVATASALTSGYQLAFTIGAGLLVAALGVATTVLRSPVPSATEPEKVDPELREAEVEAEAA